jgi:hypothetical protein
LSAVIAEKSLVNDVAVIDGVEELDGVELVPVEADVGVVELLELPQPAITPAITNGTTAPPKSRNFKAHLPLIGHHLRVGTSRSATAASQTAVGLSNRVNGAPMCGRAACTEADISVGGRG